MTVFPQRLYFILWAIFCKFESGNGSPVLKRRQWSIWWFALSSWPTTRCHTILAAPLALIGQVTDWPTHAAAYRSRIEYQRTKNNFVGSFRFVIASREFPNAILVIFAPFCAHFEIWSAIWIIRQTTFTSTNLRNLYSVYTKN